MSGEQVPASPVTTAVDAVMGELDRVAPQWKLADVSVEFRQFLWTTIQTACHESRQPDSRAETLQRKLETMERGLTTLRETHTVMRAQCEASRSALNLARDRVGLALSTLTDALREQHGRRKGDGEGQDLEGVTGLVERLRAIESRVDALEDVLVVPPGGGSG